MLIQFLLRGSHVNCCTTVLSIEMNSYLKHTGKRGMTSHAHFVDLILLYGAATCRWVHLLFFTLSPPPPTQTFMFAQMVDICHDINTWWTQLVKHTHTHSQWAGAKADAKTAWVRQASLTLLNLFTSSLYQRWIWATCNRGDRCQIKGRSRGNLSCRFGKGGCGLRRRERCCVEETDARITAGNGCSFYLFIYFIVLKVTIVWFEK